MRFYSPVEDVVLSRGGSHQLVLPKCVANLLSATVVHYVGPKLDVRGTGIIQIASFKPEGGAQFAIYCRTPNIPD